jgi:hypothetical protein
LANLPIEEPYEDDGFRLNICSYRFEAASFKEAGTTASVRKLQVPARGYVAAPYRLAHEKDGRLVATTGRAQFAGPKKECGSRLRVMHALT